MMGTKAQSLGAIEIGLMAESHQSNSGLNWVFFAEMGSVSDLSLIMH